MKSIILSASVLFCSLFFVHKAVAQDNQATFESYLQKVYDAYESGNADAMWAFYTDAASEVSPDGTLASGIKNLRAGWDMFMKMVDSKPTFTYKLTSWRLITPEVALITWDSTADIKVQGQQVGGPATCSAVLHKINGQWKIEFDGMTPVMQMPEGK